MNLASFGGKALIPVGADSHDPETKITWNFGVKHDSRVTAAVAGRETLHKRFPKMAGAWDGKSTVNHWDAVLKNYSGDWKKAEELIQYQVRGTCGGRAGSFAGDMIQHVMIAMGKKAQFHRVSHAAVYYLALKLYGMIQDGQDWENEDLDGVASGAVPEALTKLGGFVQRDADQDSKWYGNGSDDLACQLAVGLHPEIASQIEDLAKGTIVTEWVPVKSAQELADGIASGGVGIGSDSQGFGDPMNPEVVGTRDADGYCQPVGQWNHYQVRCSVGVPNGRKGFGYNQSWGKTTPGGPKLIGHPGNCFGVDFEVQDQICRSGNWAVIFGFPLWQLEADPETIPWMFK